MRSRPLSATLAAATLLAAGEARAAPLDPAPPPPSPAITAEASPIFGTGSSVASGWNEVVVRVQNNGDRPARGRVEIGADVYDHDAHAFHATAPCSVGARGSVYVRVPAKVPTYGDVVAKVLDEAGRQVTQIHVDSSNPTGVTLLDVSEVGRLRGPLNELPVVPRFAAATGRGSAPPSLTVGSPRFDPATGDPMLPDRAALYTTTDAVLMRSDTLARLAGPELDALAGWVLAGGTLAVAVVRPEDLRHPTLVALAGGPIARRGVAAATLAELVLASPAAGKSAATKTVPFAEKPSNDVAETLAGYAGGNLRPSLYGSSAAYGLGEVHLLAFDPTRKPAVDDPWVEARVVDLARRAYDRRVTQVFRPGSEAPSGAYDHVRKQLDPNEGSRWGIAAAALLLCLYAVVAGPVNFTLAGRAGRPLRALRWLPVIAAIAFAAVVGVGVLAKGTTGRSRHLTLVEAGAGMAKGAARRFRGFYASRARELTVRTTDASSLVSLAVLPDYADRSEHLVVDREGARLVDVAALPWQTVVVREDGFASLGDGIALVKDGDDMAVVNRAGRDLRAAVLRGPDGDVYYFPRIKDGERASSKAAGQPSGLPAFGMWQTGVDAVSTYGSVSVHGVHAAALKAVIEEDAPGLADAWLALEEAAGGLVDWFPNGVPVLIGQLDGGEGRLHDAGLAMESDRLLVRVVGYGGRP